MYGGLLSFTLADTLADVLADAIAVRPSRSPGSKSSSALIFHFKCTEYKAVVLHDQVR